MFCLNGFVNIDSSIMSRSISPLLNLSMTSLSNSAEMSLVSTTLLWAIWELKLAL